MEYLKNKYSEVELIKKDNWADIYVAINNETHEKVQLKVLKNKSDNTKYIKSITYEIDQLQNLKHKNLIGINGIYNFIENSIIYHYIETEYFKGKTLSEKMILTGHTCKESLEIIKQVAEGLNEFHYRGLNYETLRGENIFINSQGVAKIDVLSYIQQKYDEDEEYDNYDEFDDGIDKDIYAVGVILYQLITRDQNFKLKKLKKNIEDEEVYSILYSLTSKKIKYRYENLNEFLSDVNEHLQYLSSHANKYVENLEEPKEINTNQIVGDFDEYDEEYYESNKSVLIKRMCACLAVVLVVVGGIKVAGLVKKDNNKAETQTEMIAEEESTDEEALEEELKEKQSENLQVEPTDTSTNDYNLNSDTEDDGDNSTTQTPNYGNNNTTNNSGSLGSGNSTIRPGNGNSGSTNGGSNSGSGSSGSMNGGHNSGSGSSGSTNGGHNSGSGSSGSTNGGHNSGSGNSGSTNGGSNSGSGNSGSTNGGSNSGSGNSGSTSGGSNNDNGTGGSSNDTSDEGTSDGNTSNGDGTNTDSGDEGEISEQIQSME